MIYVSYFQFVLDEDGKPNDSPVKYKEEDLSKIVEGALTQADKNNDGYIDYLEYRITTGTASPNL